MANTVRVLQAKLAKQNAHVARMIAHDPTQPSIKAAQKIAAMYRKQLADSSPTGLYQYRGLDAMLCVDCMTEVLEANLNTSMMPADWVNARITNFDTECCDVCDCVPAAKGKVLA